MPKLSGWGRAPVLDCNVLPYGADCITPVTPRGYGRSYGDSALGSTVTDCTQHNGFEHFNPETGVLKAASGISLHRVLDVFLPKGWFLPVTPGTRFVSLGGAVAADVHGKNHHVKGSFSAHVQSIDMVLGSGERVTCSHTDKPDLFLTTCGGMGLTGLITHVTLTLMPVQSRFITQQFLICPDFESLLEGFERAADSTYSVAWVDLSRPQLRGHLMLGEHATIGDLSFAPAKAIAMPFDLPFNPFTPTVAKAANRLLYAKGRYQKTQQNIDCLSYFYPLDRVLNWNKIYGKKGFSQYQCVIPLGSERLALPAIAQAIYASGESAVLGVLKKLGPANASPLSFAMNGYTLAVDCPNTPSLPNLFSTLDNIVAAHGGRVYLAKDAWMTQDRFRQFYPAWEQFQAVRERYGAIKKFTSAQAVRLGLEG